MSTKSVLLGTLTELGTDTANGFLKRNAGNTDWEQVAYGTNPAECGDSSGAAGSANTPSHSDHAHAHGNRGGGALHSAATTGASGFMSSTDKTKLDQHGATFEGAAQTTDDTADVELLSLTPADQKVTMVEANIVGLKSDYSVGAAYKLIASFRRDGNTVTQIGTTTVAASHEDSALSACDSDIQVNATPTPDTIQVVVTGIAATTINWRCQAVTTVL